MTHSPKIQNNSGKIFLFVLFTKLITCKVADLEKQVEVGAHKLIFFIIVC